MGRHKIEIFVKPGKLSQAAVLGIFETTSCTFLTALCSQTCCCTACSFERISGTAEFKYLGSVPHPSGGSIMWTAGPWRLGQSADGPRAASW